MNFNDITLSDVLAKVNNISAVNSQGLETTLLVYKQWFTDRLNHMSEDSEDIINALDALVMGDCVDDYLIALERASFITDDGRIIQFELVDVEHITEADDEVLKVWYGESSQDVPIARDAITGKWLVRPNTDKEDIIQSINNMTDYMAVTSDSASEYFSFVSSLLCGQLNESSSLTALITNGLASTNSSIRDVSELLSTVSDDIKASTLASILTGQFAQTGQNITQATQTDEDAGSFSLDSYHAATTHSITTGAWDILSGAATAIGTVLMVVGGPVGLVAGGIVTLAAQVGNAIVQAANNQEYMTVNDSGSRWYSNGLVQCSVNVPTGNQARQTLARDERLDNPYYSLRCTSNVHYHPTGYADTVLTVSSIVYPAATMPCVKQNDYHILNTVLLANRSDQAPFANGVYCNGFVRNNDIDNTYELFQPSYNPFFIGINPLSYYGTDAKLIEAFNETAQGYIYDPASIVGNDMEAYDELTRRIILYNIFRYAYQLALRSYCAYRTNWLGRPLYTYALNAPIDAATFASFFLNLISGASSKIPSGVSFNDFSRGICDLVNNWGLPGIFRYSKKSAPSWQAINTFLGKELCFSYQATRSLDYNMDDFEDPISGKSAFYMLCIAFFRTIENFDLYKRGYSQDDIALTYFSLNGQVLSTACNVHYGYIRNDDGTYIQTSPYPFTGPYGISAKSLHLVTADCIRLDESGLERKPLITPPKWVRGTALAAIFGTVAVALAVTAVVLIARGKLRHRLRAKMTTRELQAIQAQDALKEIDPKQDPVAYNAAMKKYLVAQRRFERLANRIGYSSNNVASFGNASFSDLIPGAKSLTEGFANTVTTATSSAADFIGSSISEYVTGSLGLPASTADDNTIYGAIDKVKSLII